MGIELPPELADVAAQAGVAWPEADEEAMARQAEAWRDTAKSMSTLATDADTTARAALSSMSGDTATAASTEWKAFVEPDTGHLTSLVKDANAAADRLENAANQVGTAKVEIVRNLIGLAQNQDAAQAAASAGHPFALAGLDTAVRGTAANVANIESQLVAAVQPNTGVDMASVQNPVNASPGHHQTPQAPGATTLLSPGTVTDLVQHGAGAVTDTANHAIQGTGDLARHGTGNAADLVHHAGGAVADTAGQVPSVGNLAQHGTGNAADLVHHAGGAVADTVGQIPGLAQQGAGNAADLVHHAGGAVADTAGQVPGVGDLAQHGTDTVDHALPGGQPGDTLP